MIINGNKKEVRQLVFRHKGTDLMLRHCLCPEFDPFEACDNEFVPIHDHPYYNEAEMTFTDLYEVDILIGALEHFRDSIRTNYGLWKTDDIGMK